MYADPNDHYFNHSKRFTDKKNFSPQRPQGGISKYDLPPIRYGPLSKVSVLTNEEEDELVTVLKDVISHERELEDAKIRVAQCKDFNLVDAFHLIDVDSKGYVTAPQLMEVLQQNGVFPHKEDVQTFLREFDMDSDGRLLFSDFSDAFTPLDPYYQG